MFLPAPEVPADSSLLSPDRSTERRILDALEGDLVDVAEVVVQATEVLETLLTAKGAPLRKEILLAYRPGLRWGSLRIRRSRHRRGRGHDCEADGTGNRRI